MKNSKNICVFCSSSDLIKQDYFKLANNFANELVKLDCSLVFGGGMRSLMGELAKVFKKNNKEIVSVIPKKLNKKGIVFEESDRIIETETMSERKQIMHDISDAFVALPGGFGTLEEILEIITLKQLGYNNKPVAILNSLNFYDNLLKQFDVLSDEKYIHESHKNLYFVSEKSSEIINYIQEYKPKLIADKIQDL